MKGIEMYTRIQEMKKNGFSQNKTAKTLKFHRKTVKKYWNMTADDYNDYLLSVKKTSQLEQYEKAIISWLIKCPSISSA